MEKWWATYLGLRSAPQAVPKQSVNKMLNYNSCSHGNPNDEILDNKSNSYLLRSNRRSPRCVPCCQSGCCSYQAQDSALKSAQPLEGLALYFAGQAQTCSPRKTLQMPRPCQISPLMHPPPDSHSHETVFGHIMARGEVGSRGEWRINRFGFLRHSKLPRGYHLPTLTAQSSC